MRLRLAETALPDYAIEIDRGVQQRSIHIRREDALHANWR